MMSKILYCRGDNHFFSFLLIDTFHLAHLINYCEKSLEKISGCRESNGDVVRSGKERGEMKIDTSEGWKVCEGKSLKGLKTVCRMFRG